MSEELLRQELHAHRQRLDAHIEVCEKKFSEGDERMNLLLAVQQQQGEILHRVDSNTSGVVEVFESIKGTIKVGSAVQQFGVWLFKLGVVGAIVYGFFMWLYEMFKNRGHL